MFIYLPGADDAAVCAAPCAGEDEILVADATQSPVPGFAIVVSLIIGIEHWTLEDERGEAKIDAVIFDVALPLVFIPFKPIHDHRVHMYPQRRVKPRSALASASTS
jgi:hypothetical protein